jgi:beta-lactam-binding protein with PASTA domain
MTLRCSPTGGSLPDPAVACFAIQRSPGRYLGRGGYAVASQAPARGERVPRGALVVLRVGVSMNGGPGGLGPAGTVPRLTGIDVHRAIAPATSQGLRVTVQPPEHPVASLVVTGQSIDPGAEVTPGDTVVLTIG